MSGLRFESLADMPQGMREKAEMALLSSSSVSPAGCHLPPGKGKDRRGKFGNVQTTVAGIKFDSRKEARRFEVLMLAQDFGLIRDLHLQQDFTLQEGYTTPMGERIRALRYKADFVYTVCPWEPQRAGILHFEQEDLGYWYFHGGEQVVEDVKSTATRTKDYRIKKKLMAGKGYAIREV